MMKRQVTIEIDGQTQILDAGPDCVIYIEPYLLRLVGPNIDYYVDLNSKTSVKICKEES